MLLLKAGKLGIPSWMIVQRAAQGWCMADRVGNRKQCCYRTHTLPGCRRPSCPRTLYSMLTRRSRFSWDTKAKKSSQTKKGKHLENITRISEPSSSLWLFSQLPLFFGILIIRIRHLCHALFPSEWARPFRSAAVNVKTIVDSSLLW